MSRLEAWLDEEVALYEGEWGQMAPHEKAELRLVLSKTLHAEQLKAAEAAGALGDTVLAALKDHSNRLLDSQLAAWFRDRR